jgi:TRAP-type C4-dicarboxylate transport system substrate-binding protein
MQTIVLKHADKAAILERRDTEQQSAAIADKLRREGMTFNTADTESMRAQLKPFYNKWKTEFGPAAWDLLEKAAGKLT